MTEPMTESQIRFQNELEGGSMSDALIRELATARACALIDIDGKTTMIVNRDGLEIMLRYAPDRERADRFRDALRAAGY